MNHVPTHKESKPKATTNNSPLFKPTLVQKKMNVGSANDSYEVEADTIADKVVQMNPLGEHRLTQTGSLIQKKCAHCEEEERQQYNSQTTSLLQRKCSQCEEKEKLQRIPLAENITPLIQRSSSDRGGYAPNHVESQINSSRGGGSIMDHGTKNFMENRFGADFSDVRIHTGSQAVQMSRELHAHAFTVGNDIYFNEGKYNPNSDYGKHLLAHELTHTIQQGNGLSKKIQRNFNPGRCCNSSITGEDEWALVSNKDTNLPTVWQRLSVGDCVGNFYDTDCEGITCGGGFYTVIGGFTLLSPATCRTPGEDDYFWEDNRWTPMNQTRADALSPSIRGSAQGDTPPNYIYHE